MTTCRKVLCPCLGLLSEGITLRRPHKLRLRYHAGFPHSLQGFSMFSIYQIMWTSSDTKPLNFDSVPTKFWSVGAVLVYLLTDILGTTRLHQEAISQGNKLWNMSYSILLRFNISYRSRQRAHSTVLELKYAERAWLEDEECPLVDQHINTRHKLPYQ